MRNWLLGFVHKVKLFFSDTTCIDTDISNSLSQLDHSCALVALSRVLPNLSYDKIEEAFYNCCDKWPNHGVSHKEFNIVLHYLHTFDSFIYKEHKHRTFDNFENSKHPTILLIPGHYTVYYKGNIYDSHGYSLLNKQTKIYCSWILS